MTDTDTKQTAAAHTSAPWVYTLDARGICGLHQANNATGVPVRIGEIVNKSQREAEANARRIIAAVNACEGISTQALEQGVIAELLEALKELYKAEEEYGDPANVAINSVWLKARDAIAKATERAA